MIETIYQRCPICKSETYTFLKELEDGVKVGRCNSCNTIYTPLRHPTPSSLFYSRSLEFYEWLFEPVIKKKKKHYRVNNFNEYLKIINNISIGRKLLDVGCAHGIFPLIAQENGYQVTGIEPSPAFAKFASECLGIRVLPGKIEDVDLGNDVWDVITFTDSLEYFPDPVKELSKLKNHLSDNGVVFVKVPNGKAFIFRNWLTRITGIKSISHTVFTPSLRVVHYTSDSLKLLINQSGFEVIEIGVPYPIDSPSWESLTGYGLITKSPWWMDSRRKLFRRIGFTLAYIVNLISPSANYFSPSIYITARKRN